MATVLIIEDEVTHSELLKEYLSNCDTSFLEARNAPDGLRLAREQKPDLILMDILMQPHNAWSALHEMKSDAATRDIPVIAITIVDERDRLLKMGADDYIQKPFTGRVIREHVARYIEGYGGHDGKEDTAGR